MFRVSMMRFAALLLVLSVAVPGYAGLVTYSSRPLFDAAAPGLPVEGFEAGIIAAGDVLACPSPLDSTSNNSCFTAGSILPGIQFASSTVRPADGIALVGAGFGGVPSKAIFANYWEDSLDILMLSSGNAIGTDVFSTFSASTITISVFAPGGSLLGSYPVSASGSPTFFGVISDSGPIGRLNLSSGEGQAEGIDNVAFGSTGGGVPEPTTLVLLGLGLTALGLVRLRK